MILLSKEFVEAKRRTGNTLCPLSDMSMCRGRSCALWLNVNDNKLDRVAYNCLYRLSLMYSFPKERLDPFSFEQFAGKKKKKD